MLYDVLRLVAISTAQSINVNAKVNKIDGRTKCERLTPIFLP